MGKIVAKGFGESDGIVFRAAPAGVYDGEVCSIEVRPAGEKSKYPGESILFVGVKLQIEDMPGIIAKGIFMVPHDQMDAEEYERNTNKLKRLWLACGINSSDDELDTDEIMHQSIKVKVTVDNFNGQDSNKITDTIIQ